MALSYNTTKDVSLLVCFEGRNRRIALDPKKCSINRATKSFTYKGLYTADNGNVYHISAKSIEGSEGSKAHVIISNRSGKKAIAERANVDVRFARYLFK